MSDRRPGVLDGLQIVRDGLLAWFQETTAAAGQYSRSTGLVDASNLIAVLLAQAAVLLVSIVIAKRLYLWVQRVRLSYWSGIRSFVDDVRQQPPLETTVCPRLRFGGFHIDNDGRILQEVLSADAKVLGLVEVSSRAQLAAREFAFMADVQNIVSNPTQGESAAYARDLRFRTYAEVHPEMAIPGSVTTKCWKPSFTKRDEVKFYAIDLQGKATLIGHGVRVGWDTPTGPVSYLVTCHHVLVHSTHIMGYNDTPYPLTDVQDYAVLGDLVLLNVHRNVWSVLGVEQSEIGRLYHNEQIYLAELEPLGPIASLVKLKSAKLTKGAVDSVRSDSLHVFGFNHTVSTEPGHSGKPLRNQRGQPVGIHCARDEGLRLNIGVALFRTMEAMLRSKVEVPPPPIGESGDPVQNEMWVESEALPDRMKRRVTIAAKRYNIDAKRGLFSVDDDDAALTDMSLWANQVEYEEQHHVRPENVSGCSPANGLLPIPQAPLPDFRPAPLPKGGSTSSLSGPFQLGLPPPVTKTSVLNVSEQRGRRQRPRKSLSPEPTQLTPLLALVESQGASSQELQNLLKHLQRRLASSERSSATSPGPESSQQPK